MLSELHDRAYAGATPEAELAAQSITMLSFAFRNLFTRPVRSFLSLLGLTVAIAGMVGLFSVAEGLDAAVSDAFGEMDGLNVVQPGAPIPLFSTLPASWQEEIEAVPGVRVVSPEIWQRINVINGKLIVSPPRFLAGVDLETRDLLDYDIYAATIKEGRFLEEEDVGSTNAVISQPIADEFDARVGDAMTINGSDATIVGIYESGSILLDVAVVMDAGFVRNLTRFDPNSVSDFYVEAEKGVDPEELAGRIEEHFAGREANPWTPPSLMGGSTNEENPLKSLFDSIDRAIKSVGGELPAEPNGGEPSNGGLGSAVTPPQAVEDPATNVPAETDSLGNLDDTVAAKNLDSAVEVRTASDWAQQVDNLSADLDLILTILTSIGVLIALLSIINTMLMSVTERIIDFGILKANGWSKGDVLRLITFESGLLGVVGGLLGAAIGWTAVTALNATFPERLHLYASPQLLAFAVVFSTVLGTAAGLYPALWAMRMMPMDAIRRG